ncbi:polysaccharide deacetylase family protein [Clostridium sp. 'deep sea']|uniref:polysaccharide deacetylase family protein n=1 Tax=Clostridium sp. 'deep sea' TaxID=2779445 RepID=UPI0018964A97|nr:polysaccharide deacetylase family protein [Clostridium sp. 'deep sea']QOR34169.1 polysaccharide deacetylase family protein [Clostridium sp. 'deep sea']
MFLSFNVSRFKIPALIVCTLIIVVVCTLTLFPTVGHKLLAVVASNRIVPIYAVHTEEKVVAISFDAAWGSDNTATLLDILDEYDIKTTFFLCGRWIEEYPEKTKLIADRGHEIGNHSLTHPHMNTLSSAERSKEIMETHKLIKETTEQDAWLFRCPFGEYNNAVIESCHSNNYEAIQWDVDSLDWREYADANYIYNRVTKRVKEGSIVLFHNNGAHTTEALPRILDYFQEKGFKVVKISDILYKENYVVDPASGLQKQKKS